MLRFLPVLIELFLLVFCLIDCIQTNESDVRNLGKVWWILLILFIPVIGPVAWLVAGRPQRVGRRTVGWPSTQTSGFPEYERPSQRRQLAPDDDPEFLAQMRRSNAEQEDLLRKWEDDLRRREQDLRKNQQPNDDEKKPKPPDS